MISSAMYEVLPRGASPRCAPPAKRRSAQPARKADSLPRHRRTRQARASADKADPRRDIGGQKSPSPRHGGQGRPAPRSAAAAPARPHAYYISPFTLCQAPFFGFISRAFPDLLRPFMAFPCPFAAFFAPFCRAAGAAAGGQNGCGGAGADSVPKQTRKKPRRRGTGRTVGNARRGKNAAARRSDAVSPPLLPQSAGAQTRRAGAYT